MPRRRNSEPEEPVTIEAEEFKPLNSEDPDLEKEKRRAKLEKEQGKPLKYDPKFNGPIKNRSCTDVICCILFLIFVAGLVVVGYFAFVFGNPSALLYPMNSDKELCGFGKQKGKPNVMFFDIVACGRMGPGIFVDGCPTPQICVAECPRQYWAYAPGVPDTPAYNNKPQYCKASVNLNDVSTATISERDKLVKDEDCAAYTLESKPILNRCVPKVLSDLLEGIGTLGGNIQNINTTIKDKDNATLTGDIMKTGLEAFGVFLKAKEYGEKIIQDVVASWWMIVVGYVVAMLICLIWIVAMRWLAGVMVWFTILLFVAAFAASAYFCFSFYLDVKGTEEEFHINLAVITLTSFSKETFWLTFGIISVVVLAIVLLILLILCQRIRIAIALIKEGSRAVGSMLFTLIFPLIPFALELGVIAYWLVTSVYLASTGREPTFSTNISVFANGSYNFQDIKHHTSSLFDEIPCTTQENDTLSEVCGVLKLAQQGDARYTFYLQIYNLFMLFWLVNFFIAFGEMALAGAFASYYWAFQKPKDIPTFPLLGSVSRCFRYHLGSLAFGSLIVAIIQLIRVFLEYLDHKLKGSENPVAKFFLKCLKCCFWCLEKFIRFLNKNAYIMIAIHGKNFCASAKDAFMLILRNVVRVMVVDKVTDFLLLIGKLLVVGLLAIAAYFFFNGDITYLNDYKPTLNFFVVPIVLIVIGSYIVASCFFSVYSMAVDTLFLCFLEDLERNDGSNEKPYFMPKNLMKILGKKNKPQEDN